MNCQSLCVLGVVVYSTAVYADVTTANTTGYDLKQLQIAVGDPAVDCDDIAQNGYALNGPAKQSDSRTWPKTGPMPNPGNGNSKVCWRRSNPLVNPTGLTDWTQCTIVACDIQ